MCQLLILHWRPPWNILGQCVVRGMNIQSGPNIYESSRVRLRVARLRPLVGPIETFDFRAVASHRKLGARRNGSGGPQVIRLGVLLPLWATTISISISISKKIYICSLLCNILVQATKLDGNPCVTGSWN